MEVELRMWKETCLEMRKEGWGRVRLGMGTEMGSWAPLTTPFVHPQWVQSIPGQGRPGACGRWRAGEGGSSIYSHPLYQISPTHLNHDHNILLLELQSSVQLTSQIQIPPFSHHDCLPAGTCCPVSGWGTTTSPQGLRPHRWPEVSQSGQGSWGREGRVGWKRSFYK